MSHDPKCHDLAEAFIGDYPLLATAPNRERYVDLLAEAIQATIEGWLEMAVIVAQPADDPTH